MAGIDVIKSDKLKILFIGTAEFALPALEKLLSETVKSRVIGVVTQPDRPSGRKQKLTSAPVKHWLQANNHAHKIELFQPERLRIAAAEILEKTQPDLIVVAAYGQILPKVMIDYPKYGCLNIHGSLLPNYRGAVPIEMALLTGDKVTGVSVLQMTPGLDDGPVWAESALAIRPEDDASSLRQSLARIGADLLLKVIDQLDDSNSQPVSQKQLAQQTDRQLSHCNVTDLGHDRGEIRSDTLAGLAFNKIRAFVGSGGAWSKLVYKDKVAELKIFKAKLHLNQSNRGWGKLTKEGKSLILNLPKGNLEILEAQLPGKNRMSGQNYLFLVEDEPLVARVAIRCADEVLVFRREKFGEKYLALPGGHLKKGEDFNTGALREVWEEVGIKLALTDLQHLFSVTEPDFKQETAVYLVDLPSKPIVQMRGEELLRMSADNKYELAWVKLDATDWQLLRPKPLKDRLLKILRQG